MCHYNTHIVTLLATLPTTPIPPPLPLVHFTPLVSTNSLTSYVTLKYFIRYFIEAVVESSAVVFPFPRIPWRHEELSSSVCNVEGKEHCNTVEKVVFPGQWRLVSVYPHRSSA